MYCTAGDCQMSQLVISLLSFLFHSRFIYEIVGTTFHLIVNNCWCSIFFTSRTPNKLDSSGGVTDIPFPLGFLIVLEHSLSFDFC